VGVMTMVWASSAMINPANLRPLAYAFGSKNYDESADIGIACGRKNNGGESLDAECFPDEIYVKKGATNNYDRLPDLFFAGSYWVVSNPVADVLRQFDLGGGGLYPVKVLKKDRKTPIGDRWYCLNFGNVKTAYRGGGVNMSPNIPEPPVSHSAPMILQDNRLTLGFDALDGPDIWVDPQIHSIFFVSNRLAMALKAAGVARAFGLKKCRVI
jgi:hypothetical protein